MRWEAVMGVEVHVQLRTGRKLFCPDRVAFGDGHDVGGAQDHRHRGCRRVEEPAEHDVAGGPVETVDGGLEQLAKVVLAKSGSMLVTADHGNCEMMVDPVSGEPHTAHTTNPVPVFWIANNSIGRQLRDGSLSDLAPTVLELMGLPQPREMTGRSLIVHEA